MLLNILEGIDLTSMRAEPARYYHTLIEATKIAFADRNRYIADPAFAKVPVQELLSKDYAARRRALIDPAKAIDPPAYGEVKIGSDTTYFTVVDKDRNAVSFINSIFNSFGSGIVAGDTGIMLHNRGTGFSLAGRPPEPARAGQAAVPHADSRDGVQGRPLLMSYGVMGGDIQAQGHAQVLINLVDRGLNLQQAIDAPRIRYISGNGVMMEDDSAAGGDRGARRARPRAGPAASRHHAPGVDGRRPGHHDRSSQTGALLGASDIRKDGLALGY